MKQSKEQLLIDLTKIKESLSVWVEADERRRKEFAKSFSWYKKKTGYNYEEEFYLPSWEEIWVKVGRLLEVKDSTDMQTDLSRLRLEVQDLQNKMNQPPNHPSP